MHGMYVCMFAQNTYIHTLCVYVCMLCKVCIHVCMYMHARPWEKMSEHILELQNELSKTHCFDRFNLSPDTELSLCTVCVCVCVYVCMY